MQRSRATRGRDASYMEDSRWVRWRTLQPLAFSSASAQSWDLNLLRIRILYSHGLVYHNPIKVLSIP
jgi:hypothetical protein